LIVMVILRHTFKDFNAFSSRAWDWAATLTPEKGYEYIRTYSALPLKNEAWCIWDIANPMAIADFQREAQPPKEYLFSFVFDLQSIFLLHNVKVSQP